MGYHQAGFSILGVDIKRQKRYPFAFIQADVMEVLPELLRDVHIDAIHASPPCQAYSKTKTLPNTRAYRDECPRMIEDVRAILETSGLPYVIENVPGAPLKNYVMLCGLMFDLKVFRHRLFESNCFLFAPEHIQHAPHRIGTGGFVCCAGHGDAGRKRIPYDHRSVKAWRLAMEINWMVRDELTQAIPPAYTKYIGGQILNDIRLHRSSDWLQAIRETNARQSRETSEMREMRV